MVFHLRTTSSAEVDCSSVDEKQIGNPFRHLWASFGRGDIDSVIRFVSDVTFR